MHSAMDGGMTTHQDHCYRVYLVTKSGAVVEQHDYLDRNLLFTLDGARLTVATLLDLGVEAWYEHAC